jgi:hypothetical protein
MGWKGRGGCRVVGYESGTGTGLVAGTYALP